MVAATIILGRSESVNGASSATTLPSNGKKKTYGAFCGANDPWRLS